MGTNVVEATGLDRLPTLARLVEEGASTFEARTEVEQTVTLPNHAGMLTGRPVDPAAGGHGVTVNGEGDETVQGLAGGPVESVFDVVHASGGSTALFATEEKFALFERSWPESIDRFTAEQDQDAEVLGDAVDDLLAERRTLTFVHLGLVDEVGHRSGWLSADQLDAAATLDVLLGDLVDTVSADRRLARRLVLVVTADHGGVGKAHADTEDPRDFTVPFLVWGAGVEPGADLYDLNPQLADPGDAQPGYDDPPPVRNGFVANLVTQVLGLDPVDGSRFAVDGVRLAS
jgi:predicted AlkP superfamily pyrophosphatase or phosphodiesterase